MTKYFYYEQHNEKFVVEIFRKRKSESELINKIAIFFFVFFFIHRFIIFFFCFLSRNFESRYGNRLKRKSCLFRVHPETREPASETFQSNFMAIIITWKIKITRVIKPVYTIYWNNSRALTIIQSSILLFLAFLKIHNDVISFVFFYTHCNQYR